MPNPDEIVVVSGLPRSGISLMMQILADGGIEPLADRPCEANLDNPTGYFDFERVKKIKEDKAWLPDARGRAVKVISQLLYDLPDTEHYKILFMRRDIDEIIVSLEAILVRRGQAVPNANSVKAAFVKHLDHLFAWLSSHPSMSFIEVDFNELVTAPETSTQRINEFLANRLDLAKLLRAIDPALDSHRDDAPLYSRPLAAEPEANLRRDALEAIPRVTTQ